MIVKVRVGNIKGAVKQSSTRCPVARALRQAGFKRVEVARKLTVVNKVGKEFSLKMPKAVENFIYKFDSGEEVRPFSFRIRNVLN